MKTTDLPLYYNAVDIIERNLPARADKLALYSDERNMTSELAQALIAYCREHMADYKRPRWIEFVDELPKTATGKIQRFKLRA